MRRRLGVASLLVCVFGCGGDNKLFKVEDLAAAELQAACARAVRCRAQADVDQCVALLTPNDGAIDIFVTRGQDPGVLAAVTANKATFHGEHADECLTALQDMTCDISTQEARVVPDECSAMFEGQLAEGDACEFDGECASGRCLDKGGCDDDFSCCLGTCIAPAHSVALGDTCDIDSDCAVDAFCAGAVCMPLLVAGAHCSQSADCAFGLLCLGLSATSSGSCKVPPVVGEACPDHICAELGARCDEDGMCVEIGHVGDDCTLDRDCEHELVCDSSGKCALPPALGQPCASLCKTGSWCHLDADTITGTCEASFDNGTFCEFNTQCLSGVCAEGQFSNACIDRLVCF